MDNILTEKICKKKKSVVINVTVQSWKNTQCNDT